MVFVRLGEWCRVRYRYVAYFVILVTQFVELMSRFGVPLAMIGGMVKEDCDDPSDQGSFCWSEDTKALIIGAFFYGYTVQFPITFIAKKIGFLRVYRAWMVLSAVLQVLYPILAAQSTTLLAASQIVRGLLAGVQISYQMEFTRHWTLENESNTFISSIGATGAVGNGAGALLSGLITTYVGWQYYFYLSGSLFLVVLLLDIVLVQESPATSRFMCAEEKLMYKQTGVDMVKCNEAAAEVPNLEGMGSATEGKEPFVAEKELTNEENRPDEQGNKTDERFSLKDILCRVYLWAFCVYFLVVSFIYYNTLSTLPFYLEEVLNVSTELISSITIALGFFMAFANLMFAYAFQRADRYISWIRCRMLFIIVPLIVQIVIYIVLPYVNSIPGVVAILAISAGSACTMFSGGVVTINYEMDPVNSSLLLSIFLGVGQMAGFLGPLMMAKITYTDLDEENYDEVHRRRWSYFYFSTSGAAVVGIVVIVLAYVIRPSEWVNRSKEDQGKEFNTTVIENPVVKKSVDYNCS